MEVNNVNRNNENVVAINLKIFIFSFLKIVEIEFKIKLQSFLLEFSQVPANHDLSYLSPYLLKWNESKFPMFIKNIDNKKWFFFFFFFFFCFCFWKILI